MVSALSLQGKAQCVHYQQLENETMTKCGICASYGCFAGQVQRGGDTCGRGSLTGIFHFVSHDCFKTILLGDVRGKLNSLCQNQCTEIVQVPDLLYDMCACLQIMNAASSGIVPLLFIPCFISAAGFCLEVRSVDVYTATATSLQEEIAES